MLIVYVINYDPKSTRFPLGDRVLLKDSPNPLKFQKNSAPRKYTTSEFSSPLISGAFIPCNNKD